MAPENTQTNIVLLPKQNGPAWLWLVSCRIGRMIQKKFWLVLLTTVTMLVGTFVINELQTPLYEAQSTVAPTELGRLTVASDEIGFYASIWEPQSVLKTLTRPEIIVALSRDKEILSLLKAENDGTVPATPVIQKRIATSLAVSHDLQKNHYVLSFRDVNPGLARAVVNGLPKLHNHLTRDLPVTETKAWKNIEDYSYAALARQQGFKLPVVTAQPPQTVDKIDLPPVSESEKIEPLQEVPPMQASAPIAAPTTASSDPSLIAELKKNQSAQAEVKKRLSGLENGQRAPYQIPDTSIRSAYQASVVAKAKLENWLKNYQIPPEEQAKLKNDIAAKTARFNQLLNNATALARRELADLQAKESALKTQIETSLGSFAAAPTPPAAVPQESLLLSQASAKALSKMASLELKKSEPAPVVETPPSVPQPDAFVAARDLSLLLEFSKQENFPLPSQIGSLKILTKADRPDEPFYPNKTLNLAVAAVAGFLLGCALAAGVGFHDETISSPSDIEKMFHVPVLALVPQLKE